MLEELQQTLMAPEDDPWKTLMLYPFCLRESCKSFGVLASRGSLRDCYVIARTVLETAVTYCFIAAGGKEIAARAWRHALQKSYRDLSREMTINDRLLKFQHHGHRQPAEVPGVAEALEEFSTRAGKEQRRWTSENLREQVEAIDRAYGPYVSDSLVFALVAIFRHSSEITHGTYFGALFALGFTEPGGTPASPEDITRRRNEHIGMLCLMLGLCIDSVIRVTDRVYPMQEALTASDEALAHVRRQQWASHGAS